jgi:oxygen-independent coproporphyrinogen-3 oxidase
MAGIYIHIPFCKRKCHYCNFFSIASKKHIPAYLDTLKKEIELQKDYLENNEINTIYFGGGTPSLFSARQIERILKDVNANFKVSGQAEITIEANPDDVTEGWVNEISSSGINRVSLGVQSFFDEDLAYLNRIHDGREAELAIMLLKSKGYDKLTIDLIYGIPGLTDENWEHNLNKFFQYDIPHLSAYALTVENKTALDALIKKGKSEAPDDKSAVSHFKTLLSLMEERGYIHYEISNFAREGFYSRHNSLYWTGGHYLGLGPSAHSYNGRSRRWNKASMKAWMDLVSYFEESFEEEVLTKEQRFNEYVMTSLRTVWGCDLSVVRQEFGQEYLTELLSASDKHISNKLLIYKGSKLFLTSKGKLFADGIASDLFI